MEGGTRDRQLGENGGFSVQNKPRRDEGAYTGIVKTERKFMHEERRKFSLPKEPRRDKGADVGRGKRERQARKLEIFLRTE